MNKKINFRCDETFEDLLFQKMNEAGYDSYSEFIRESVQHVTIKQRCKGIQELIKEINKIGVNLNQITKHVNEQKVIDQFALNGINQTYKQLTAIIQRFNHHAG
ncbi:plasmid mobilization protein [Sulfurovum sp. CS9]|uniref:plasmid mobilization protein n=1 Tax=Sulfurovum sp. CS9 TaxID=3391146 RepID=UPI0039E9264A